MVYVYAHTHTLSRTHTRTHQPTNVLRFTDGSCVQNCGQERSLKEELSRQLVWHSVLSTRIAWRVPQSHWVDGKIYRKHPEILVLTTIDNVFFPCTVVDDNCWPLFVGGGWRRFGSLWPYVFDGSWPWLSSFATWWKDIGISQKSSELSWSAGGSKEVASSQSELSCPATFLRIRWGRGSGFSCWGVEEASRWGKDNLRPLMMHSYRLHLITG